jgi:hypothetical protein
VTSQTGRADHARLDPARLDPVRVDRARLNHGDWQSLLLRTLVTSNTLRKRTKTMKYDLELTGVDKQSGEPFSATLTLNHPKEGIWKADGASTITGTGGGSDNSTWVFDKANKTITLNEMGWTPKDPPDRMVVLDDVGQMPLTGKESGTGKTYAKGVKLQNDKSGKIKWRCTNAR